MKLGLNISLRPSLQLKLAPQLIQSLKMLQMPLLKLEQTLRHELAINPLLDEIETEETNEDSADESEFEVAETQDETDRDDFDWDQYLYDDEEGYKVRQPYEKTEERFEGSAVRTENLYDHLTEQLSFLKLSDEEHLIGEYVIGNIGPDGYLSISVSEMAAELQIDAAPIDRVLKLIQYFDPTGVGARDLRESLKIQLREKGQADTLAYRIVDEHINDLEKKSILQISKMMGVSFERTQKALEVIRSLNPTPTHGRFDPAAVPVVPDLVVEKVGSDFVVFHNDKNIPRLRINAGYRQLIKRGNKSSKDTKDYIRQKLEQARWLLNSINQRRSTMIRVMEAIIEEQREFFERGAAYLRPLIMEDIAQKVEMNVATISRVSNSKYVQTPLGVFELKYFFNSGISRDDGEDMSKPSVKQRIEEIIKAEPPDKPLSDQEIFKALNDEGIKLARRTVTKYRKELNIKPARFRKRVC
jgi:RNA polymerase sigma-54 factor